MITGASPKGSFPEKRLNSNEALHLAVACLSDLRMLLKYGNMLLGNSESEEIQHPGHEAVAMELCLGLI